MNIRSFATAYKVENCDTAEFWCVSINNWILSLKKLNMSTFKRNFWTYLNSKPLGQLVSNIRARIPVEAGKIGHWASMIIQREGTAFGYLYGISDLLCI